MKFNRFTEKSLRAEFPFLKGILDGEKLETGNAPQVKPEAVSIKKMDAAFLHSTPRSYDWTGSVVNIHEDEKVFFVLKDGSLWSGIEYYGNDPRRAVETSWVSGSNYAHSERSEGDGESILHAIDRHGVSKTLSHIVVVKTGVRCIEHHSEGCELEIWKPAKGLSIKNLIDECYQEAEKEVAIACDF